MRKLWRVWIGVLVLSAVVATGCQKAEDKKLIFGVAPGPYGDMLVKGIKPGLEQKGYIVEVKEFSDYVQPNLALANKEISANLFQHAVYLEKFAGDHNLQLSPVINVPTAAVGLYSETVTSLHELKEGSVVTIANDPTNLTRALKVLQQAELLSINPEINTTTASEKDVKDNPKQLKITPVEAAQLPRTLQSADLSAINGNFAIAAGIDLSTALYMEQLEEDYKNLIAVRTEDLDEQFVKDIKEVVQSDAFQAVINDPANGFSAFQKPEWFK